MKSECHNAQIIQVDKKYYCSSCKQEVIETGAPKELGISIGDEAQVKERIS